MQNRILNRASGQRAGVVDVWNAFMLEGALYDKHDIPVCPTTSQHAPTSLISWPEAKRLHRSRFRNGESTYRIHSFVHFYVDDAKFDGARSGIWNQPHAAIEVLRHFDGMITPDYSVCPDFPDPIKRFATYRMRSFGYWAGCQGIPVINNVRWGSKDTWDYCFRGLPTHSILSVGTVASGLRHPVYQELFNDGLHEMALRLKPEMLIVYGSLRSKELLRLPDFGIDILHFPSQTSLAFDGSRSRE